MVYKGISHVPMNGMLQKRRFNHFLLDICLRIVPYLISDEFGYTMCFSSFYSVIKLHERGIASI